MGSWALKPVGIHLLTTNQSESLNCTLKRFQGWKKVPLDLMVTYLFSIDGFFAARVARGRYGIGEYPLRKDLASKYPREGVKLPVLVNIDEIIRDIKSQKVYFLPSSFDGFKIFTSFLSLGTPCHCK